MSVQHPWIHGACHWPKEDPWRYCYHFSRLNELVNIAVEWLESRRKQHIREKHHQQQQRVADPHITKARKEKLQVQRKPTCVESNFGD